jgi:hypothetical protein
MTDEWLRPLKILDTIWTGWTPIWPGRLNGRVLGPEWLKQVGRLKNDPAYPFELPPDLELSVDDVKQHWAID